MDNAMCLIKKSGYNGGEQSGAKIYGNELF
jgi:hypothetical protein